MMARQAGQRVRRVRCRILRAEVAPAWPPRDEPERGNLLLPRSAPNSAAAAARTRRDPLFSVSMLPLDGFRLWNPPPSSLYPEEYIVRPWMPREPVGQRAMNWSTR